MLFVSALNQFMAIEGLIQVSVVFAAEREQRICEIEIPTGTTLLQAVVLSKLDDEFPDDELLSAAKGIFGKRCPDDYILKANDRIEIYRPLIIDPREARRQRVTKKQEEKP